MCGIVAIVRRPSQRRPPAPEPLRAATDDAALVLGEAVHLPLAELAAVLGSVADRLDAVDRELRGVPGLIALIGDPVAVRGIDAAAASVEELVVELERRLDTAGPVSATTEPSGAGLEDLNAALIRVKDAAWALRRDRLTNARAVADLAGHEAGPAAIEAYGSIQLALSAIDRLEVRGRDSAGLHVYVWDHDFDGDTAALRVALARRGSDPLYPSGSVRAVGPVLSFVYKAAAEIGELGDNTRALRHAIVNDDALRLALAGPRARASVLGHTRWASVGLITQANTHPLNSEELDGVARPYLIAALNGDVDNHADLKAAHDLQIAPEITTDAKVIPALVARLAAQSVPLAEGFRRTVASFEGSVAIGAAAADEPNQVLLAQRGSGQGLYVGVAEDAFLVASEPYGLVEGTSTYLRLDGETPSNPDNPANSRGQVVVLDGSRAGSLDGIIRLSYDGTELPVSAADLQHAQITTRDIDRGTAPHFLLKELGEAPASFRKTLRGRIVNDGSGRLRAALGPDVIPPLVTERLRSGAIRRIAVIGQGTAAIAGQSVAEVVGRLTADRTLWVGALPATELSGFGLRNDMSDTLVVAISQSGTTTDTNRTVDLARGRGACVIGIVNRRNSDLTDKADGVLFTSDGRDVEMSVASTKAFYAQVAAGVLLACALAELLGVGDPEERSRLLGGLLEMPVAMQAVLARRGAIAQAARQLAPSRRYWAVVGNGSNRVAAQEARIKLSELCYKSIACDVTEDKKHIDLSSEPLILVCAAGLSGSNADDVAKEVAIYRAHKAAPIVVATEGDERFNAAYAVVTVPPVQTELAFVLSALVGHLFAYEAALAIDGQARPLREAKALIDAAIVGGGPADGVLDQVLPELTPLAARFFDGVRTGALNGHLEASTAVRVASLLRYATGAVPLDSYETEHGRVGSPSVLLEDLSLALTRAIEELTRPVDAIKHQAKTVTVGISRSDETLVQVPLVQRALEAGTPRDRLTYRVLRTLAGLHPAVEAVTGFTRYRVDGDTVSVVDRGGIAQGFESRTSANPTLRGNKRFVATRREVMAARGQIDGRTIVLVPEVKGNECTGITLLHVRFADRLPAEVARAVLESYNGRYAALVDAVTETEPTFRDDLLADVSMIELLSEPVRQLAARWRA